MWLPSALTWTITRLSILQVSGRPNSSPLNALTLVLFPEQSAANIICVMRWDYRGTVPWNATVPCALERDDEEWALGLVLPLEGKPSPFENFDLVITRRYNETKKQRARANFFVGDEDENLDLVCGGSGVCTYAIKDDVDVFPVEE